MSGHNKWSKIKYVKAKEDAKKGKVFAALPMKSCWLPKAAAEVLI